MNAEQQAEYEELVREPWWKRSAICVPCAHCGRATDFGRANLCRGCWVLRNTPDGPAVHAVTAEELEAVLRCETPPRMEAAT